MPGRPWNSAQYAFTGDAFWHGSLAGNPLILHTK